MDNPETPGTQHTARRQTKHNTPNEHYGPHQTPGMNLGVCEG
jgi:hypothetical protein